MNSVAATSPRPVALITGASGGIGREVARLAAADGHDLIVTARSRDALEALHDELQTAHAGCTVTVLCADLAAHGGAADLIAQVEATGLDVDVLINNAGFGTLSPFAVQDPAMQTEMVTLNVLALQQVTRELLPGMLERGRGRIANVASVAGFLPGPYFAAYHATKAYVVSLSLALSAELAGTGVTVTCICPGPTRTGFQARADTGSSRLEDLTAMRVETVARQGYRAIMRGRTLVVNGARNKLLTAACRLFPIRVVNAAANRLYSGMLGD